MKEKDPSTKGSSEISEYVLSSVEARNNMEAFVKNIISPFFYETHRRGVNILPIQEVDALYENLTLQENIGALLLFTQNIEVDELSLAGFKNSEDLLTMSLSWISEVWAEEISRNPQKKHYRFMTAADRMITRERNSEYTKRILGEMTDLYLSHTTATYSPSPNGNES